MMALSSGAMPHGHLQRVEAAPGDAHHAYVAVRPRLVRQPGNDLLAVELLLLRVFAVGGNAFAGAEAADIHAGAHVSAAHKVGVSWDSRRPAVPSSLR